MRPLVPLFSFLRDYASYNIPHRVLKGKLKRQCWMLLEVKYVVPEYVQTFYIKNDIPYDCMTVQGYRAP